MDVNSTKVFQTTMSNVASSIRLESEIEVVKTSSSRKKNVTCPSNERDVRCVRSLAGKLAHLGVSTSPLASLEINPRANSDNESRWAKACQWYC